MALPTPPSYTTPIPNNPFFSPQTDSLYSALGPLIVGSGLSVNYDEGTIGSVSGSVSGIFGGAGISVSANTGNVVINNTGVRQLIAGPGITLSAGTGIITISGGGSGGPGTVTSITAGTGLNGGTITTSGTIDLADTTVTPGSYTLADITVDQQGRITAATDGAAVTSVTAGTGLTGGTITSTGTINLDDTAVSPGSYTYGSFTVDQQGRLTSASNGTAPVTSVTGTAPIVSSGGLTPAISLANTAVTPGSYTYASVTVDAQGRLTAASSGVTPNTTVTSPIVNTGNTIVPVIGIQTASTGQLGAVQVGSNIQVAGGVISVRSASTTQSGIVQLNDTVASTSTTEALTAAQGKVLQDQINTLSVTSNLTFAGTFDAFTAQILTVSSDGSSAGLLVGSNLPAPTLALTDFFVIVTTGGSYSPPGGGGPYFANQGDWFLCNGTSWQYVNVGTDLPVATTGTAGIVELATVAETETGTSTTLAVTPAGAAATYVPIDQLTGQGALITATAANTPATLALGTNGQVLTACNAAPEGLCWTTAVSCVCTSTAFTGGPICTTGTLDLAITGVSANTYTYPDSITVDACGRVTALSSSAASPITCLDFDAKGDILVGFGNDSFGVLPVGGTGEVLTACPAAPSGLCWAPASTPSIPCSCLTTKGDLITTSTPNTPVALPVGTNGQILSANSACTTGLEWVAGAFIPCCCITGKGSLVTGTAADTPTALAVGADGKYLVACSACASGLTWADGCSIVNLYPVIRNANYTYALPSTVFSPIVICYNQIVCDSTGWYDGSTGVFRPTVPGYYQITALGRVYGNNVCTSEGSLGLVCNGANIGNQGSFGAVNSQISTLVYMNGSTDALCVIAVIGNTSGSNNLNVTNSRFTALLAQAQVAPTQICGDTPVGTINWFAASSAPSGWLVADGRAISRTGYADLFAVVGTTYGSGDGSTTFNLPDLRGQFIRGWDAAGGTARGCDTGRAFGSTQGFALQSHCHQLEVVGGAAGRPEWACPNNACPAGASYPSPAAGGAIRTAGFTSTNGSSETRPINVALLPCIKWATTIAPANPSSCGIPCSTLVSKGALVTASSANTPVALPLGTNGQVLMANSTCASGLEWQNVSVGPWISAGTIQSVGWNSTGGALVVPGAASRNNVSYRQVGAKEWEVVYSFTATGAFVQGGTGNYLFTLPNGLQFNTALPWQPVFTTITGANYANNQYMIPGSSVCSLFTNGTNASIYGAGIVVYDATRFRIFATDVNNAGPQSISPTYWGAQSFWSFTATFQFTSP